ncbi:hypothetical protein [Pseudomonas sp. On1]|uniref:hypothetical protein n=1 Tax=Pseudomonas sp. On1 TaxID=3083258 RepID=UPI0029AB1C90|nr:hypothetical protein [Pseudomonas sp. On1]MDX2310027.1 hypothetical protein [Pseudomonas sp. On1]
MVFSLLAPDEVSTSGIVAVEVNGQHNEESIGFKRRAVFFDVTLPAVHFSDLGMNRLSVHEKSDGYRCNQSRSSDFWQKIGARYLDVKLFTDGMA